MSTQMAAIMYVVCRYTRQNELEFFGPFNTVADAELYAVEHLVFRKIDPLNPDYVVRRMVVPWQVRRNVA